MRHQVGQQCVSVVADALLPIMQHKEIFNFHHTVELIIRVMEEWERHKALHEAFPEWSEGTHE